MAVTSDELRTHVCSMFVCLLAVFFFNFNEYAAQSKAHFFADATFGFKKFPAPLTHIFPKLITPVSCAKNPGYVHMTSASRFRVGLQSATYNAMSYHCVGDVLIRHHVVIYLLGSSVLGRAITSADCPRDSGDLRTYAHQWQKPNFRQAMT